MGSKDPPEKSCVGEHVKLCFKSHCDLCHSPKGSLKEKSCLIVLSVLFIFFCQKKNFLLQSHNMLYSTHIQQEKQTNVVKYGVDYS